MVAPVWLSEEPEIKALLHAALDRFDRQPAEERERDVFLTAERLLLSLSRSDAAADNLWHLVRELERSGVLKVRSGRPGPYDPQWKGAKLAFPASSEVTLREWLGRDRAPPELARWRAAVQAASHVFAGACDGLLARRIVIDGRSPEEVVSAFVRMASHSGPITLRQLSALCFWGDSKILDDRADLVAQLFPQLVIRERAIVVSIYLPARCEGVLFIENQDTYTAACDGVPIEVAHLALVFASGFRSSAQRVRSPGGAILHYAGPGADGENRRQIERWWFDQDPPPGPCWFWGDLDFAGMQILKSLRSRFGDVSAWPPGYERMLATLRASGGYSTGGQQVDPVSTGCALADEQLLPAIRTWGHLDQECPAPSVQGIGIPGR